MPFSKDEKIQNLRIIERTFRFTSFEEFELTNNYFLKLYDGMYFTLKDTQETSLKVPEDMISPVWRSRLLKEKY